MKDNNCELYVGKSDNLIPYVNADFVYDKRTGNYHLIPECQDDATEVSNQIMEKIQSLHSFMYKNDFKNKLNKQCRMVRMVTPKDSYFKEESYDYSNAKNIFSYIRVFIGNMRFDLLGIRFYKKNKKICCSLKNVQFIKLKINNLLSCSAYPDALENKASKISTVKENIEYFNPKVEFDDTDEIIINAFVEFINKRLQD